MLLPVFGVLLLLYTQSDIGHRALKMRIDWIIKHTKEEIVQQKEVVESLSKENAGAAALVHYMGRSGCHPVYDKTAVTYFPEAAGGGQAFYFYGIFYCGRRGNVGQGVGNPGKKSRRGRGCPRDV